MPHRESQRDEAAQRVAGDDRRPLEGARDAVRVGVERRHRRREVPSSRRGRAAGHDDPRALGERRSHRRPVGGRAAEAVEQHDHRAYPCFEDAQPHAPDIAVAGGETRKERVV